MKLTDFALIFVAILLPILIIVFVNTSFVVKAEKQEMYYKNLINSAVEDAVSSMKHIENENKEIDYGYSGIVDKKVSVNATTAINTLYNSLANNFNIAGNKQSLEDLKMYIPVVAILDYDGIYIHSAHQNESGNIEFITKPKVYYTYNYVISKTVTGYANTTYSMLSLDEVEDIDTANIWNGYIFEVNFTMDDYIYLNVYSTTPLGKLDKIVLSKNFYITDKKNNDVLVEPEEENDDVDKMLSSKKAELKQDIIDKLTEVRKEVIAKIGMKEISSAVNKHNVFARQLDIKYTFRFSVESDEAWYESMDGIGMIAVIQGISLGNRYLNYKAYSASDLIATNKYYLSKGVTIEGKDVAYFEKDLYHISKNCKVYMEYLNSTKEKVTPSYYTKKAEAATQGFYPCPICKP